jgi:hypothetical protein
VDATAASFEMTRAAVFSDLASEFDDFLFAPIREDKNGMLLSVLSALARLDVDPWEEAAKLAEMPGEVATQRLSTLIGSLPTESASDSERRTIAARLVALLPRRPVAVGSARKSAARSAPAPRSAAATYAIYYVIFMLFILLSQWLMGGHPAPAQIGDVAAARSATAPAPAPPRTLSP